MEVSNISAFLPLLAVLEFPNSRCRDGRGYKILSSTTRSRPHFNGSDDSLYGWLDENGYSFRVEVPLVVSVSEILLIV